MLKIALPTKSSWSDCGRLLLLYFLIRKGERSHHAALRSTIRPRNSCSKCRQEIRRCGSPSWLFGFRSSNSTGVIGREPVPKANRFPTRIARIFVGKGQQLTTTSHWTFRFLHHFRVIARVTTTTLRVFLHCHLTTFSEHSLHALCANRTNKNAHILVILIRTAVRLVAPMLETKHLSKITESNQTN